MRTEESIKDGIKEHKEILKMLAESPAYYYQEGFIYALEWVLEEQENE